MKINKGLYVGLYFNEFLGDVGLTAYSADYTEPFEIIDTMDEEGTIKTSARSYTATGYSINWRKVATGFLHTMQITDIIDSKDQITIEDKNIDASYFEGNRASQINGEDCSILHWVVEVLSIKNVTDSECQVNRNSSTD